MTKKLLISLGLVVLLLIALAGCGGSSDNQTSSTTATVPSTPTSPPTQQPPDDTSGNGKGGDQTTSNPKAKTGVTAGSCMNGACAIVHKQSGWKVSAPPSDNSSPIPQPQTISKSLDATCQLVLFTSPPQANPPAINELSGQFGVVPGQGYKQIGKDLYLLPISKVHTVTAPVVSADPNKPIRPGKGRVVSLTQVGIRYLSDDGKKYAVPLSLTTTPKKTKPCSRSAISMAQGEITSDLTYYLKSAGI